MKKGTLQVEAVLKLVTFPLNVIGGQEMDFLRLIMCGAALV